MSILQELVLFFPEWEQWAWAILGGTFGAEIWKRWRRHKGYKPKGFMIATVSGLICMFLGILTIWADTHDATQAIAGGVKVGIVGPGLWWGAMAVMWKFTPWLAASFGEDRRRYRSGRPMSASRRVLFEDTGAGDLAEAEEEVRKWRESVEKNKREGHGAPNDRH